MTYPDSRTLKERSRQCLAPVLPEARRVAAIYTAALAVLSLASSGLQLYLDTQIGGTGGLGGMGLRSVLQAIQEFLSYVNMFFGPFWGAGFLYAMVRIVRGAHPQAGDLTAGFRKFLKIFGYIGFELLIAVMLLLFLINLASTVYLMTPWGAEFMEIMEPYLNDPSFITADGAVNLDMIPVGELTTVMIPMFGILLALFLPMYTWLSYHFRMAMYLVMTHNMGGIAAHLISIKLMRGHKWQLLKLDLSYWWYYLLQLVISLAAWLDVLLPMVGIQVPFDATVMYFATLILYGVLLLAVNVWKKCEVDCACAAAYEDIAQRAFGAEPQAN